MRKETIKQVLNEYLVAHSPKSKCDANSLISMLYCCYHQQVTTETAVIRDHFEQLDDILSGLSLRQADQVLDVTCKLCCEFQKDAFCNGLLVGIKLYSELQEHPTSTD